MSKFKMSNLKKDICKDELIKIDFCIGDDSQGKLLNAGEQLEKMRI